MANASVNFFICLDVVTANKATQCNLDLEDMLHSKHKATQTQPIGMKAKGYFVDYFFYH
jgi:hypothetical protein